MGGQGNAEVKVKDITGACPDAANSSPTAAHEL
jgi:hypothetical protein